MINETETKNKFGYISNDIGKFSQKNLICNCDICGILFEKTSFKIFSSRKNSKSEIDLCENIKCIKKKRENTMIKRYGVINAGQSLLLREKREKTNVENYGKKYPMMNEEFKNVFEKSNIKKYGFKNVFETDWCKEKIKQTCLQKYGVEFIAQSDLYKEKVKNTCLEKYGVSHFSKTEGYKNKCKKTNLKKWNTEWYIGSKDRINKTKNFYQNNYNVNSYNDTKEFKEKFKKITFNRTYNQLKHGIRLKGLYEPLFSLDEYNGVDKEYKFKCLKCNNIFLDNIDDGSLPECKICYPPLLGSSKMEEEIVTFLSSINQIIVRKKRKLMNNKYELDIFIPSKNIAIELNGNYWHSDIGGGKNKMYHLEKLKMCEKQNIRLIQIFEDEWLYKQDIIKSRLKSILNIFDNKIYARNCIIKNISNDDSKLFLNKYHLQGCHPSIINLGLYYNDELISVMTLSKLRLA